MSLRRMACCGIREYSGLWRSNEEIINNIKRSLRRYGDHRVGGRYKFVIFSGISNQFRKLDSLKDYIRTNRLGTTEITKGGKNPNSDNNIKVLVWNINLRKLLR